jgi:Tol biopolymer transport system component
VLLELAGQTLNDPVYAPSGHILFSRAPTNAGVWALPFSLKTLKAEGEPFLVTQGMRSPSASMDGTLVMLPPRRQRPLNLAWTDRAGNILSRIDEPRLRQPSAAISPDGNRVAVVETIEGKADLWQYDIQRNTRTRLTVNGSAREPVWFADGRSLLLTGRAQNGQGVAIQRVSADGSGRAEDIVSGGRPAASRDGTTVFFSVQDKDGMRLWYRPLPPRDGKPARFLDQAFYAISAAPSPDGHLVAYEAEPGPGQSEIYLRRFPPSEGMWQVSTSGGTSPRWSRDGHLYYANGAEIFEVEVTLDPDVRVGTPVRLFKRTPTGGSAPPDTFDVSPDGKRFLIYEPVGDPAERGIAVVQHWFSEFAH